MDDKIWTKTTLQAIELLAMKGSAKLIEFGPLRSFDVQLPRWF